MLSVPTIPGMEPFQISIWSGGENFCNMVRAESVCDAVSEQRENAISWETHDAHFRDCHHGLFGCKE
jgi:hypothetical protein